VGIFLTNGQRYSMKLTDYKALVKELGKIDQSLVKGMKAEFKQIAQPVADEIKSSISKVSKTGPLGPRKNPKLGGMRPGFDNSGRLAWGRKAALNGAKPFAADSTLTQINPRYKKGGGKYRAIARVRTRSAGTGLADMAGRSGRYVNSKARTKPYEINLFGKGIVKRDHRINNQGKRLIENLNSGASGKLKSSASRYVWPAAEKAIPKFQSEAKRVLEKNYDEINRRLAR
jgi:hypothetical protein